VSGPLNLYVMLPSFPERWKTQADFWNEQKRWRRVHVVALISVIISTVGAVGASLGAMAVMSMQAPVLPEMIRVECIAPATPPVTSKGSSAFDRRDRPDHGAN
jgi:hypothetical protein